MIDQTGLLVAGAVGVVGFLLAGYLLGFSHGYAKALLATRRASKAVGEAPADQTDESGASPS